MFPLLIAQHPDPRWPAYPRLMLHLSAAKRSLKWQIFRATEPHCPRNKLKWRRQLTLRWRDEWRGCVNRFLNFQVTRSGKTLAQWFPPAWPVVMLRLINCPSLETFCSKLRKNNSDDSAAARGFKGGYFIHLTVETGDSIYSMYYVMIEHQEGEKSHLHTRGMIQFCG